MMGFHRTSMQFTMLFKFFCNITFVNFTTKLIIQGQGKEEKKPTDDSNSRFNIMVDHLDLFPFDLFFSI